MLPWRDHPRWEWVQAFSAGYNEQVSLTELEAQALITAWRLQRASSIVYWTGWLREGKVTHQSVVDAVTEMLLLEVKLLVKLMNLILKGAGVGTRQG